MQPAMLEVTEVVQQANDPDMALWMVLVAFGFKVITYYGKHIPNDEPGIKGVVGKVCRAAMLYTPNREKKG